MKNLKEIVNQIGKLEKNIEEMKTEKYIVRLYDLAYDDCDEYDSEDPDVLIFVSSKLKKLEFKLEELENKLRMLIEIDKSPNIIEAAEKNIDLAIKMLKS